MWQDKNNQLYKEFTFKDFQSAFAFMEDVADVAERMNHHPRWLNEWNKVQFWLYTHSAGGVTEKDESLAKEIDAVYERHKAEKAKLPKKADKHAEIKLYADGGSGAIQVHQPVGLPY